MRISLYKIVRHLRIWYYRRMSTLKPIGSYKCIQPVLFLGRGVVRMQGGCILDITLRKAFIADIVILKRGMKMLR